MKIINTKSLMILSLFLTSMIAMPAMVTADDDNNFGFDQFGGDQDLITGFQGGFGSMLGGLGYAGNLLGQVFLMLFQQAYEDISATEMMSGVYVLSGFNETSSQGINTFGPEDNEIHLLPESYDVSGIPGDPTVYCEVVKEGTYWYNLTVGVGITLIVWDHDHSFINAVKRLISFFKVIEESDFEEDEIPEDLIREGIELITWFLIHINDIFTGDELFILNPITWQKIEIIPDPSLQITKNWYYSADNIIGTADTDFTGLESKLDEWNATAIANKDSYMQWLLRPTEDIPLAKAIWTQFSFDLIQLWVKNFEIHIDLGEIFDLGTGEGGDFAQAFGGCDIEFYLFTHHLVGAFLYNDLNFDDEISVNYVDKEVEIGGEIKNVSVPISTELSHRLILNGVENFNFMLPHKNPGGTISWGLELVNVNISAVPVGIDLDSYLAAPNEHLAYTYFGFTFDPERNVGGADAVGKIKLDQYFAPWNDPVTPNANADITGLDMAIIYVSTVLHFHLNVKTLSETTAPTAVLDPEEDYVKASNELKIGNYLGGKRKLDFVDIAGPYYEYGPEDPGGRSIANASTAVIPLALWIYEMERHDTFIPSDETNVEPFATDIRIDINFTALAYAVCYPEFEDGTGIWHDPTFSVYMVFQTPEFWALVVLIAGVGLVGVATILIKRRKDMRV